jgi:hypothetical protein
MNLVYIVSSTQSSPKRATNVLVLLDLFRQLYPMHCLDQEAYLVPGSPVTVSVPNDL